MTKELKVLLFSLFSFIAIAGFVGGLLTEGTLLAGIILLLQIVGLIAGSLLLFVFLIWVGNKIFGDK